MSICDFGCLPFMFQGQDGGSDCITKTCPCNKQQIFHGCKKDNSQMKNCDVFLIFAQNIDYGYTLEPPH